MRSRWWPDRHLWTTLQRVQLWAWPRASEHSHQALRCSWGARQEGGQWHHTDVHLPHSGAHRRYSAAEWNKRLSLRLRQPGGRTREVTAAGAGPHKGGSHWPQNVPLSPPDVAPLAQRAAAGWCGHTESVCISHTDIMQCAVQPTILPEHTKHTYKLRRICGSSYPTLYNSHT